MTWKPIDTAPFDELVLVCRPESGNIPVLAIQTNDGWRKTGIYGTWLRPLPTFWIKWPELPELPKEESE